MMAQDMDLNEEKIKQCLTGDPGILVAFLYGSQVNGPTDADSDVDIAVLYARNRQPDVNDRLQLTEDLVSITKRQVDLLILNEASPIICMQVLRKGKKIFERDHRTYLDFFVKTINEYDDLKRIRAIIEQNIMQGRIYG